MINIKEISQMSIDELAELEKWLESMGEVCSPPFDGSYSYDTLDGGYHSGVKLMLCTCIKLVEKMGISIEQKLSVPVEFDEDACESNDVRDNYYDYALDYYDEIGSNLLHFLISCSECAGFSFEWIPARSEQGAMEECMERLGQKEFFFKDFLSRIEEHEEDSQYYTSGMFHLWNDSLGILMERLQSEKMGKDALQSIRQEKELLYTLLDEIPYIIYAQPEIVSGLNRYGSGETDVTYSIGNILFEDMSVGGTYTEGSIMPTRIVELLLVGELVFRINQKLFGKECSYDKSGITRDIRNIA